MEEKNLSSNLRNKGAYYYFTKYPILIGFCIVFYILIIYPIFQGKSISMTIIVLTFSSGLFFLVCQFLFSRLFPHKVKLYQDKIEFFGPWKIGKQAIKFSNIKSISYSDEVMVIMPKWPGLNKVAIFRTIDPENTIRNEVLRTTRGYSDILIRVNTRIWEIH